MIKERINIGIIESSDILYEGLLNILLRKQAGLKFYRLGDLDEFSRFNPLISLNVVLMNTLQVHNRMKLFRSFRKHKPGIKWIGVLHSLSDSDTISEFDDILRIDDRADDICRKVCSLASPENPGKSRNAEHSGLSERETEVLRALSEGLSNKEIADRLNISIHTVISHRKSLTQKTGIKSQSGLTIFAISNNIIRLD
ncbi:MAG TPA: helix-turn-helix transcriptional regulator [Bacteroidales bacterium]|nr:helix-turn-helix transcriptional regulator [Bacteroidales bacterium]